MPTAPRHRGPHGEVRAGEVGRQGGRWPRLTCRLREHRAGSWQGCVFVTHASFREQTPRFLHTCLPTGPAACARPDTLVKTSGGSGSSRGAGTVEVARPPPGPLPSPAPRVAEPRPRRTDLRCAPLIQPRSADGTPQPCGKSQLPSHPATRGTRPSRALGARLCTGGRKRSGRELTGTGPGDTGLARPRPRHAMALAGFTCPSAAWIARSKRKRGPGCPGQHTRVHTPGGGRF